MMRFCSVLVSSSEVDVDLVVGCLVVWKRHPRIDGVNGSVDAC